MQLPSRSSHINLCPCLICTLFCYQTLFLMALRHFKGMSFSVCWPWSVTINAIADWHALACNLKWHKTCLNGHLWICCKICLNIKTLNLFCFFCLVVDLFINVAHQHDPLEHCLLLIWERCDLKGPCLCFLIQLRDGRHTNLTVKRQPCLNNNGILKIRHS